MSQSIWPITISPICFWISVGGDVGGRPRGLADDLAMRVGGQSFFVQREAIVARHTADEMLTVVDAGVRVIDRCGVRRVDLLRPTGCRPDRLWDQERRNRPDRAVRADQLLGKARRL